MILTSNGAAHRAWVADYKTRGPELTQYAAYVRGFNEGAAHALEEYMKVVPQIPTIDAVRAAFQATDRRWTRERIRNFLGNLLP